MALNNYINKSLDVHPVAKNPVLRVLQNPTFSGFPPNLSCFCQFFTFSLRIASVTSSRNPTFYRFPLIFFCFKYFNYKAPYLLILLLLLQVQLCDIGQQKCFNNNQDAEEGGSVPSLFSSNVSNDRIKG